MGVNIFSGGSTIKGSCILIIESDEALALGEASVLEEAGCTVVRCTNVSDGIKKIYEVRPDLIIVSRELPMLGVEDPCLRIRQASLLPMMVIGSEDYLVETLELGADAYMVKPPAPIELVARVAALLRRKKRHDPPDDNTSLDIEGHTSRGGNGTDELTPTDFRLASCLMLNKGKLLSQQRLISDVWGGREISPDTLHFHMRRLRKKLAIGRIISVRGLGCYLKAS